MDVQQEVVMKLGASALMVGVLLAMAGGAGTAQAADPDGLRAWMTNEKLALIERSLVIALETPCCGAQASAAQTVRDLKALLPEVDLDGTVIPLMRLVKDEDAAMPSRVMAALALHELRDGRGDYAIAGMARFSGDERLQRTCKWLMYERALESRPRSADEPSLAVAR